MRTGHLLLVGDAVGGVWQYSISLAEALQPFGYQVTMAVMGPPLAEAQRAEAAAVANLQIIETGLELDWLAKQPDAILNAEARLAEMAADLHVDLVQLHTPALASRGCYSCPVIAVLHSCVASWWSAAREGQMPEDFVWRTALVERGLRQATLAIAPTAAFAQAAGRIYGVTPLPVHNGRTIAVRQRPMQDYVFTAGRLWDEGKNLRTLDEAAASIPVPFQAAGPLAAPHGGEVSLRWIQPVGSLDTAALADHLGRRPVFASAALYEPFGLAVLEAAIAGCALVLSDIPTFRELWDGAALFVNPCDAPGFARAITETLADTTARNAAGRRAQERAVRYTPAVMAAQMAAHYSSLHRRAAA